MFRSLGNMKKGGTSASTLLTEIRFAAVDTELTGLDERKDAIVSLGAVRMRGGRIEVGKPFYRLVNPRMELTAGSVTIHEITPSELREQPGIDVALRELLEFCGDAVLVGHFIGIDLGFLNRELMRIQGRAVPNPALDTFSIYEWLWKRTGLRDCMEAPLIRYRLHDIVKCFDIPLTGAHNAVRDAYTTAQLLQRFLPLLLEEGIREFGDLARIGAPFRGGDCFRAANQFVNF